MGDRSSSSGGGGSTSTLYGWAWFGVFAYATTVIIYNAYKIRMGAIEEFGPVIHEFDPYFNYRATEYLFEHGAKKFFSWFDYMVWYPLGTLSLGWMLLMKNALLFATTLPVLEIEETCNVVTCKHVHLTNIRFPSLVFWVLFHFLKLIESTKTCRSSSRKVSPSCCVQSLRRFACIRQFLILTFTKNFLIYTFCFRYYL